MIEHLWLLGKMKKKDVNGNVDEITEYREARWVGSPEVIWRIYAFDLHKCHPLV
jgi:hypothetical protein